MSSHEVEVQHLITSGPEVSDSSNIQYVAVCRCGWRSAPQEHELMAETEGGLHEMLPWSSMSE